MYLFVLLALLVGSCSGKAPRPLASTTAGAFLRQIEAMPLIESDGLLIYEPPGAAEVEVRSYRYDEEAGLTFDLYLPAGEGPFPVMVVAMVFSASNLKEWFGRTFKDTLSSIGLGAAAAAHGIATVWYEVEDPLPGFGRLMSFLDRHGRSLGLDVKRLSMYATSANGEFATRLLADPVYGPRFRAAMFFHANLEPSLFRTRDLACYVVWSQDGSEYQQAGEVFRRRAEANGILVETVADASAKAFERSEPSAHSVAIVRRGLEFLAEHLAAAEGP
jgi:hypothetical protein